MTLPIVGDLTLERLPITGKLADAVTNLNLEFSVDEVSQLTITLTDAGLVLWGSRQLLRGSRIGWQGTDWCVTSVEISDGGNRELVKLTCQPWGAHVLRTDTGAKSWDNVSPTEWLRDQATAVGLNFIGQPTATRGQIVRKDEQGKPPESTWDVARMLADEEGMWLFEDNGTLYLAKPSWLALNHVGALIDVWRWPAHSESTPLITVPHARVSDNNFKVPRQPAQMTGTVAMERALGYRAGMAVQVQMVGFNGRYIVTKASIDAGKPTADVTIQNPVDPDPRAQTITADSNSTAGTDGASAGTTVTGTVSDTYIGVAFHNALVALGYTPTVGIITTAVAVALAESRGNVANHNSTAPDDSWGLWQINVYHNIHADEKARIEAKYGVKLNWPSDLTNPVYNALAAAHISSGGTNWKPWTTFTHGTYKQYLTRATAAANAVMAMPKQLDRTIAMPATTTQRISSGSISDFIRVALSRNGDKYKLGSVVNVSDPDQDIFDCSGLVEWSAGQIGIRNCPRTAAAQFQWVKNAGRTLTVAQAIKTPGALLFRINSGATNHVAISLGDGRTIEAMGTNYGVRIGSTAGRFNCAGLLPGIDYPRVA